MVELARAISLHPAVHRVELLTRLIQDPKVAATMVSCSFVGCGNCRPLAGHGLCRCLVLRVSKLLREGAYTRT